MTKNDIIIYTYDNLLDFTPQYDETFQKVSSIEGSESNCFNFIQELSEKFECWAQLTADHDPSTGKIKLISDIHYEKFDLNSLDGFPHVQLYIKSGDLYIEVNPPYSEDQQYYLKIENIYPAKYISFKKNIGTWNDAGFKYGINLKSIERSLDSKDIVTKLIVKPNSNEYALNTKGTCTIQAAESNFCGENFLLNFNHYFDKGILDYQETWNDLYTYNEKYLGYYIRLRQLNQQIAEYNYYLNGKGAAYGFNTLLIQKESELQFNTYHINSLNIELNESIQTLWKYSNLSPIENFGIPYKINDEWQSGAWTAEGRTRYDKDMKTRSFVTDIIQLISSLQSLEQDYSILQTQYDDIYTKCLELAACIQDLTDQKTLLHQSFLTKYEPFIREGSWIDENYIDDNKYFQDSQIVSLNSCVPALSYTINLVALEELEGYSNYKFNLGDNTYIIDTEFFGYEDIDGIQTPRKETVVVTELIKNLDDHTKDIIKVQNYTSKFEDLFSKITASVQSLQYAEGSYNRVANILSTDGVLVSDILQNSIEQNNLIISNAHDQSVVWDETGITVSCLSLPNNIVKIVSEGILMTTDGGKNWITGISGAGINASVITTGQLNTNVVEIYNGSQPTFRWDHNGLSAYAYNIDNPLAPYSIDKYIRFDKFGIYGISGLTSDDFVPVTEESIWGVANFGMTWNRFWMKNKHGNHSIEISSDNDFTITKQFAGEPNQIMLKIGASQDDQGNDVYGINIWNNEGKQVFATDNNGNLIISGAINAAAGGTIGGWYIGVDKLYSGSGTDYVALDSSRNGYAIWAGDEDSSKASFSVKTNGLVTANKMNITGGSINLGDNFTVDSNGNVNANGRYKCDGKSGLTKTVQITSGGGSGGGSSSDKTGFTTIPNQSGSTSYAYPVKAQLSYDFNDGSLICYFTLRKENVSWYNDSAWCRLSRNGSSSGQTSWTMARRTYNDELIKSWSFSNASAGDTLSLTVHCGITSDGGPYELTLNLTVRSSNDISTTLTFNGGILVGVS